MITNGNTQIASVYLGTTKIEAVYKGEDIIFAPSTYSVETDLNNITSDAPASVVMNAPLTVTLTPNIGLTIDVNSVVVTMGGVDITATAYSAGIITIAEVTGNVSITADTIYDAEVEYLQGDGAAYINTGIIASNYIMCNLDFTILDGWTGGAAIFGSRVSSSANQYTLQFYLNVGSSPNYWRWAYYNRAAEVNHNGTAGTFKAKNTSVTRTMEISGDHTITLATTNANFSNNLPIFAFCMNSNGGPSSRVNSPYLQIKRIQMYDNGTRVRFMNPVRKHGVGYLYDTISGQLFGNANSTGAFVIGPDKND